MNSNLSWGKAHILSEALMLYGLTWMFAVYLIYTEAILGVVFLVLAFTCITAIFTNHFIQYDREVRMSARRKTEKARGGGGRRRASGKSKAGTDSEGEGGKARGEGGRRRASGKGKAGTEGKGAGEKSKGAASKRCKSA